MLLRVKKYDNYSSGWSIERKVRGCVRYKPLFRWFSDEKKLRIYHGVIVKDIYLCERG